MQATDRKIWRSLTKALVLLAFILLMGKLAKAGTIEISAKATESNMLGREAALAKMAVLPASFISNQGQVSDADVRYLLQGKNSTVYLTDDALVFRMSTVTDGKEKTSIFKMTYAGAEKTTAKEAEKLPGVANYLIGPDKNKWYTSIPTYAQVRYKGIYPGIDLAVWGSRNRLKYEFQLAPCTNANTIQIDYSGIEGLSLDDKGNLHISTAAGEVIDYAPFAYQHINGQRVKVPVSYRLIDKDSYGFSVTGDYDESLPLIIDPDLTWSTFLGGNEEDSGEGIAIDSSGNVYVTGKTNDGTTDFPTTSGAYDESHNGIYDVFVSKLNSTGSSLTYSTFIGGNGTDVGYAIAVDGSGNAYVTGECDSGFPTTNNAYDESHNGGLADVFIVKLNSTGSTLSYSTFIGGADDDRGYGIEVDGSGDIYVTGKTDDDETTDFPTTNGAYDTTHNGGADVFVVKLSPDGSGSSDLLYSTFIGGSGGDYGRAIDVYNDDAYVTGNTYDAATDFPTTGGAYDTSNNGDSDAFLAQISPDGSGSSDLEYSTFLGGNETDHGYGIAVDSSGDAYVTGQTEDGTTDFPTTSGAYDESHNGGHDVFAAKVSPDGSGSSDLVYSTFIGGSGTDGGYAIALNGTNAFVTGKTTDDTTDFPTTSGAYDEIHNGDNDVFACALKSSGDDLYYSTFLGGSSHDYGYGIAVDSGGNAYLTGKTFDTTTDLPTTSGAYDESHNGGYDVFVCKLAMGLEPSETELTVTTVRIFTDSDFSEPDSDGISDCQVHFGHKDGTGSYAYPNLYIEIDATGGDSGVIDTASLYVTSESDTTGIEVSFTETGVNTNTYRVVDPMHLSTASNETDLELQVLDEETLSVDGTDGPEVDRGEVATITVEFYSSVHNTDSVGGADALDELLDKDEGSDPDPYYWWDGGDNRRVTSGFESFVKDVGDTSSSYPADFLFECSHGTGGGIGYAADDPNLTYDPNDCGGMYDGEVYVIHSPGSGGTPTITSTDWEKDIEWAVFYSCHVLGQAGVWPGNSGDPDAWTRDWDDALIRGSSENNCHGILASADSLNCVAQYHMPEFCDAMKGNGSTVIEAWMDSALEISSKQWPAAALFHEDNVNDYLNNVTADTDDSSMYYTWYTYNNSTANVDTWEASYGTGQSESEESDGPDVEFVELAKMANGALEGLGIPKKLNLMTALADKRVKVTCDIPTAQPLLSKLVVRKEIRRGKPFDKTGFEKVSVDNRGRTKFKKRLKKHGPIRLSKAEAKSKAEAFVRQRGGGIPNDAKLTAERQQMVMTYDALDTDKPRNKYVKKAFFEYTHSVNGIQIVGGNRGDSIFVTLEDDQVVGLNRHWRDVVGDSDISQHVISAGEALGIAVENIPIYPDAQGYKITKIKLFYYGLPSKKDDQSLTPAWGIQVNHWLWVYVDAFTGEFLI